MGEDGKRRSWEEQESHVDVIWERKIGCWIEGM
jgi:hypothetical protein